MYIVTDMCVYMCVYGFMYTVCVYVYRYECVGGDVCVCVYVCACIHVCTCIARSVTDSILTCHSPSLVLPNIAN